MPKPGSLELPIAIDAHCHIFNVEDVPAAQMLKGPVAHTLVDTIDKFSAALIDAFADLISAIAVGFAPSARAEMRMLVDLDHKHREIIHAHPNQARAAIDAKIARQRQEFIDVFSRAASDPKFMSLYLEHLGRFRGKDMNATQQKQVTEPFSSAGLLSILTEPIIPDRTTGKTFDPGSLVRFAYTLTSPRFVNLARMQKAYSGGSDTPAIDVFCPSNLDLGYWLGCPGSATSQDDHMLLVEQIAIMSGGAILPFIGYNPRSDLEQRDESFERVVDAVCNRGFIGVKIYPPMGYRPFGNTKSFPSGGCPRRDDANAIDEKLARLYQWCAEQNVPVMSHTSHSFGSSDALEECASPLGWQCGLDAFPGLRVQAGHFGGDSKYALHNEWAAEYVRMMSQRRLLHADLSNLDLLLEPGSEVRRVLEPLFTKGIGGSPATTAASRLVYGSDWYMMQLSNDADSYARRMSAYLGSLEVKLGMSQLREWIFGGNAVELYGLKPGFVDGNPNNGERLNAYYARKHIPTPGWMRKLGGE